MYGRKVKLRFLFVSANFLILILTVFLVLKSLEENVVYFKSPTEIKILSAIKLKLFSANTILEKEKINKKEKTINL